MNRAFLYARPGKTALYSIKAQKNLKILKKIEQLCKEAICLKKDSFSSLVDRTTAEEKLLALQRDLDYYVQAELYGI